MKFSQIRKEMDDKLRLERNSLKSALDASHASELSKAVEAAKKEVERDTKSNEKKLQEDNNQFQQQIQTLRREVNALNQKLIDAVNEAIKEGDKKVWGEKLVKSENFVSQRVMKSICLPKNLLT